MLADSGYRCFYGEGDGPTLSIYCLGRRIVQEGEDRHKCYFLGSAVHNAGISIRNKINNYKSANYILFLKGIISQNHVTHKLSNNFRIFICQYKKYSYISLSSKFIVQLYIINYFGNFVHRLQKHITISLLIFAFVAFFCFVLNTASFWPLANQSAILCCYLFGLFVYCLPVVAIIALKCFAFSTSSSA